MLIVRVMAKPEAHQASSGLSTAAQIEIYSIPPANHAETPIISADPPAIPAGMPAIPADPPAIPTDPQAIPADHPFLVRSANEIVAFLMGGEPNIRRLVTSSIQVCQPQFRRVRTVNLVVEIRQGHASVHRRQIIKREY